MGTISGCGCRKLHLGRSSDVRVFVEYATESVTSTDAEVVEPGRVGDRIRPWTQRRGAVEGTVGPMLVDKNTSYSLSACSRCAWFQIRVRSQSSCRQV
jgi:hypothetical protein